MPAPPPIRMTSGITVVHEEFAERSGDGHIVARLEVENIGGNLAGR